MKEQNSNVFAGFKSEKPSFPQIGEVKDHPFRLIAWGLGDSFTTPGGAPKDNLPPWEDPTPEVWLHLASEASKGTIFYHANGSGYVPFDKLTKEQVESGAYEAASSRKNKKGDPIGKVYAITEVDGRKVRVHDPEKTAQCGNIFNQILAAFGIEPGTSLDNAMNSIMAEKKIVIANIVSEEFDGGSQLRVSGWRNPAKVKVAAGSENWEDGKE